MNDFPWYALSPSPFSLFFYSILIIWGAKQLLKRKCYGRWRFQTFTFALFIVGFVVLIGDFFWVVACALRFAQFFPDSVMQLVFCAGRNLVGIIFCYLMIGNYFKSGILTFKRSTIALLCLNLVFLTFWFSLSPNPAWTDWTFAIRYNYPLSVVWTAFFISHILGKIIVGLIYYSLWES